MQVWTIFVLWIILKYQYFIAIYTKNLFFCNFTISCKNHNPHWGFFRKLSTLMTEQNWLKIVSVLYMQSLFRNNPYLTKLWPFILLKDFSVKIYILSERTHFRLANNDDNSRLQICVRSLTKTAPGLNYYLINKNTRYPLF